MKAVKTFRVDSLFGDGYIAVCDASTQEILYHEGGQAESYDLIREHKYTLQRETIRKYRTEEQAEQAKKYFKRRYKKYSDHNFMYIVKESNEPFIEEIEEQEQEITSNINQLELF